MEIKVLDYLIRLKKEKKSKTNKIHKNYSQLFIRRIQQKWSSSPLVLVTLLVSPISKIT